MLGSNYFLLEEADHPVIVHGQSGLRLNVFSLETQDFRPAPGEIHIFGDDHGEWLAFETDGWTMEDMDIISGAVRWYAIYLDYPFMEITTTDPRDEFRLRVLE